MTFEHKIVVGLAEIKALIFECKECGARLSFPPEKMEIFPKGCPNNHRWDSNVDLSDSGFLFSAFVSCLKKLREPIYERVGFKIFLEFDQPKP